MKRLSITLMAILCLMLSIPAIADDNNRTPLTIRNESFTGIKTGEVYRDLNYYVMIELNSKDHLIEITHFGIGNAEVYIVDQHNQVVKNVTIYEGVSIDFMDVPAHPGNYTIVIWSGSYYGEAYFRVE